MTLGRARISIAIGASGAETVIVDAIPYTRYFNDRHGRNGSVFVPIRIPAGVRVAVRIADQNNTMPVRIDVMRPSFNSPVLCSRIVSYGWAGTTEGLVTSAAVQFVASTPQRARWGALFGVGTTTITNGVTAWVQYGTSSVLAMLPTLVDCNSSVKVPHGYSIPIFAPCDIPKGSDLYVDHALVAGASAAQYYTLLLGY